MTRLRFGSNNNTKDLAQYAAWCRAAEGFGFELLGFGDSQLLWMDPFIALTVAAQNTTTARIGPVVANPVTRHPAVMASAMSTLQNLSGGRAICALGSGDSALRNIGIPPVTRTQLEEYALAVKGLCAGNTVRYQGHELAMQWQAGPVPVWLSAEGPKMLELAGRIADGVIIGTGLTEDVVKDSIARVKKGAESAGRDPSAIEMWGIAKPFLSDTEEEGWTQIRGLLALSANKHFRHSVEGKFLPESLHEPVLRLQQEYAYNAHADFHAPSHNARLVEKHGLTEFLGRRFSICGSNEQIIDRLHQLAGYGVRNLIMIQMVPDQIAAMRWLSEKIFPAFQ